MIVWAIVACVIAFYFKSAPKVYWTSVLLVVPGIAVSQVEYGLLPMAGIVHAFAAGLYPLILFWIVRAVRRRRTDARTDMLNKK
jgi:hypothetical protein